MKTYKAALASAFALTLTGCAQNAANTERPPSKETSSLGLTSEFRACYAESKKTWLVAVVAGKRASPEKLSQLVKDFVGTAPADVAMAKANLASWQIGKFIDSENMAGSMFDACMSRLSAAQINPGRSVSCYKEQWIAFIATEMRYERKLPMEEATNNLLRANSAADEATQSAIRRVVRDTYKLSQSAGDVAYFEAQFHTCMNVYKYKTS